MEPAYRRCSETEHHLYKFLKIIDTVNGVHSVKKRGIIRKLGRLGKKKRNQTVREVEEKASQFPSPPKGRAHIIIFKEKEKKGKTVVIEQLGGFIDFHITEDSKLIDSLMEKLAQGYYVKVDNLKSS